ncbi:CDP-glycerol glycerophosphotransferase family protein [Leucobacter sp. NPDC058333]|uniref:CDP-glycerol glycerophosphotransferase family protein n=1 Tax=Leucobacter sp. NPDC058333 TaxID=3346450 RepID=UPI00365D1D19
MRRERAKVHIDYAVLSDWNAQLERPRDGFRRLQMLVPEFEGPIGLLSGSRPRFSSHVRSQVSTELTDAVERGELQWLTWRDETHVGTLLVDNPEFLLGLPSPNDRGITAGVVKIVLDETVRHSAQAVLPPIGWCTKVAREAFGADVIWLVASAEVQNLLTQQGHAAELINAAEIKRVRIPENPKVGIVLPGPADNAQWDLRKLKSFLPDSNVAEVRIFDEHGVLPPDEVAAAELQVVRASEMSRLEFLQNTDILLPDVFGERLLAAESWIRLCGEHRVVAALPDELETWQLADIVRYPPMGSRDVLSVLAVDPAYRKRWDQRTRQTKKQRARGVSTQAHIRFVVFESDKLERCERTRESISALTSVTHAADIHLVAGRTLKEIAASGALAGLSSGDRICIVRAGTEFTSNAFERFSYSAKDDLQIFTEASETYALNRDVRNVDRVVATSKASPLWAGSTPLLVRADTFGSAARRFPWATAPGLAFASILAICGTFGVLGEVNSHHSLEDRAEAAPKALKGSWYTEFARDWAAMLSEIQHIGPTRLYLHRVFIYLLSVRMHLNSGRRQRRAFTPDEFTEYCASLSRALQFIGDEQIWAPGKPAKPTSGAIRQHLLRLKHGTAFTPTVTVENGEPRTVFGDLAIERPRDVQVRIDTMSARNGILTIHGNYPITSEYAGWDLYLQVRDGIMLLPDRGRYADTTFHGIALGRSRTFSVQLPFADVGDRLAFYFSDGKLPSTPLRLRFTRPSSKLSEIDQAYWAVPDLGVLSVDGRAIAVEPYSRRKHVRAEIRRQRALRGSQDPEQLEAARLRLKYFLTLPRYRKRRIWMYADRIVNGGDNGEYAYMYAADQHDEFEKYYVLQPGTALESRFASHGTPYLEFGTDEQRLHFLNASIVFATRLMPSNTFGFQYMQKHFRDLFSAREIYINHGLVVDQLDYVLNTGFTGFDRVCVVSETERHNLLQPNYGYRPEQVEVTGFARYDGLRSATTRTLLLAPTWRTYLHTPQQGDTRAERHRDFTRTPYYRVFDSLINSPRLHDALARYNYRLSFLLHPNVAAQVADFKSSSDRVSVISGTEDVTYEQLLTTSDLMITDYSGVQFDFAFMRKPVVYYQPAAIPPHYQSGSFDYERDAFGDVAGTEDALLALLDELMARECAIEPKFEKRIERFFAHLDYENSRRIYDVGVQAAREEIGE